MCLGFVKVQHISKWAKSLTIPKKTCPESHAEAPSFQTVTHNIVTYAGASGGRMADTGNRVSHATVLFALQRSWVRISPVTNFSLAGQILAIFTFSTFYNLHKVKSENIGWPGPGGTETQQEHWLWFQRPFLSLNITMGAGVAWLTRETVSAMRPFCLHSKGRGFESHQWQNFL